MNTRERLIKSMNTAMLVCGGLTLVGFYVMTTANIMIAVFGPDSGVGVMLWMVSLLFPVAFCLVFIHLGRDK